MGGLTLVRAKGDIRCLVYANDMEETMAHKKSKYDYFDAFVRQTEIADKVADLLISTIDNFTTAENTKESMEKAHVLEHQGDDINHETYLATAHDFITPFDRDDILNISQALDDVIDSEEKVIQQFYIMDIHFMHKNAHAMADVARRSCNALHQTTIAFTGLKNEKDFRQGVKEVNSCEEEGDRLFAKLERKLHTVDNNNPMRVLVWSRIFNAMESCNDACEHAADLMDSAMAKSS